MRKSFSVLTTIVFGSYVIISTLLLKYPTLLHRKKRLKFNGVHISHRGGAFEGVENTIDTFQHAASACGTDMLHLDVQLTRDGQVVVAHEDSLRRLCGCNVKISELRYQDLPPLMPVIDVDFMSGVSCLNSPMERRQIPLLREVFERFPQTPMMIDIKRNEDELIEQVFELIVTFGRQDITVWGSISDVVTQKCFKMEPSIPIIFSAPRVGWLIFAAWSGLLPFLPIEESCLSVFHPRAQENNRYFRDAAGVNPAYWFFLLAIDLLLMRPFIFNHLRRRGIQVYLWVINDRQTFDRCFELGATGVMTDCPTLLRSYLSEHPHITSSREL
ncbi:lysophospholipase D GDPD1 [Galendromus occidentalis]|uniref:Lysophospholipase D GDPD1 n=1 Tax=Galendromus occidentalis TaxID=34638 RepID=A0AAJ6QW93_9ACAR|nr:lysophospholipase D GDPD1 [Galendromus occidentalis]